MNEIYGVYTINMLYLSKYIYIYMYIYIYILKFIVNRLKFICITKDQPISYTYYEGRNET